MFLLALLVGAVVIVGCGGAGSPGVNSPAVAQAVGHDPNLVGTWMLIWGTKGGVVTAPSVLDNWATGATRGQMVFGSTGAWAYDMYGSSGKLVGSNSGTWSTAGTTLTLDRKSGGIGTVSYTISGNVFTISVTGGGVTDTHHYVKIVTLTAHDTALEKTWKATGVWLNGVSEPVSYLTGGPSPIFARSFLANGTSQPYFLGENGSNREITLPKPALQNWATGGGLIKYLAGSYQSAIYTLASGKLTIWELDAQGNTLKVVFAPYGAAGAHDARFLGTWHPVSATVGGKPTPVSTVLNWEPGVTTMPWTFLADGTLDVKQLKGSALVTEHLDTWFTSGTTMTFVERSVGVLSFAFPSASSLTCSATIGGQPMVMHFTSGP
jgi:hypothetical protein